MRITIHLEDTKKGLAAHGEFMHNGITDSGTSSLSAHILARIALMLKEAKTHESLVVIGDLTNI